jgi:hypothetical protein
LHIVSSRQASGIFARHGQDLMKDFRLVLPWFNAMDNKDKYNTVLAVDDQPRFWTSRSQVSPVSMLFTTPIPSFFTFFSRWGWQPYLFIVKPGDSNQSLNPRATIMTSSGATLKSTRDQLCSFAELFWRAVNDTYDAFISYEEMSAYWNRYSNSRGDHPNNSSSSSSSNSSSNNGRDNDMSEGMRGLQAIVHKGRTTIPLLAKYYKSNENIANVYNKCRELVDRAKKLQGSRQLDLGTLQPLPITWNSLDIRRYVISLFSLGAIFHLHRINA